jgi:hypothetical protein
MNKTLLISISTALLAVTAAQGQQIPDVKIDNHDIQIHAFATEGFIGSDDNNFLTMKTNNGSFAMTDFAVNASTQLTDKLRIGAQMYDYNVGVLGKWQPTLDWGYLDYKFKDWLGIRAGKVKTVLGLYNDTQDATFLYTWALMPQSIYPLDLRAASIAHLGGDIYGHVGLGRAGAIDYTTYYGYVQPDKNGGNYYSTVSSGVPITNSRQLTGGEDIRWTTPIAGLTVGNSVSVTNASGYGVYTFAGNLPYTFTENNAVTIATYADYVHSKWHFSGEFRRTNETVFSSGLATDLSDNAFFVGAAYRVAKHLELGTYNSRIYLDQSSTPLNPNTNHIFDQSVTARVDLTNYWNVKIEGHFMNGYGDLYSARGFYFAANPQGLKPDTNMIIVRTGVNF